jgi:putative spermidine/putrescine transport system permease protein
VTGVRLRRGQLAAVIPTLFMIAAFVVPLVGLAVLSLRPTNDLNTPQPGWTLEQYRQVLDTSYLRQAVLNSLWLGIRVAVTCAVVAYPVAWFLTRTTSRWARTAVFSIVLSPLLTSEVVRSFGWRVMMGGQGPVNSLLQALQITDDSVALLRSGWTVYLAIVHVLLPFAIITLTASLGAIDDALLRASANLGASRTRTFFTVVLPLSVPGLSAGLMVVFSLAMGIYVTPLLVGGATMALAGLQIQNMAMVVFDQPGAAALSFVLLTVTLVVCGLIGLLGRFAGRRPTHG